MEVEDEARRVDLPLVPVRSQVLDLGRIKVAQVEDREGVGDARVEVDEVGGEKVVAVVMREPLVGRMALAQEVPMLTVDSLPRGPLNLMPRRALVKHILVIREDLSKQHLIPLNGDQYRGLQLVSNPPPLDLLLLLSDLRRQEFRRGRLWKRSEI